MEPKDISTEQYREYDFADGRVYRITSPWQLYVGATTHRVVDATGVVHCIPFPSGSTILRWKSLDTGKPVNF